MKTAWETTITNCNDKEGCDAVNKDLCKRFPALKKKCAFSCGTCKCKDTKSRHDVDLKLCEKMPDVFHSTCAKTCGKCGNTPKPKKRKIENEN